MNAREHVALARQHLASGDPSAVPYAALEVRMAIESITYDKLCAYAPRLPAAVLETWQPPQAMKALIQLEPHAGSNAVYRMSSRKEGEQEHGPWLSLGEHRSFDVGWLTKSYHSLGSLLHVPTLRKRKEGETEQHRREAARTRVGVILEEVAHVSDSQALLTLAVVINFECAACGSQVLINEAGARETGRAVCLSPQCAAEHEMHFESDGRIIALLIATEFDCLTCKAMTTVEHRNIEIGKSFPCASCGATHEFVSKHWGYALRADIQRAPVQPSEPGA